MKKAAAELALISGQKPLITKAKKSIAGFRLREGVAIGAKVTFFVDNACTNSWINWYQYHFHVFVTSMVFQLNHLMDVVTTLGVKEQLIFPEINFDDVDKVTWYGYRYRNYC